MSDEKDIFCKIIAKELPAKIVDETDDWIAIHDINPATPTHVLIIPKRHGSLRDYDASDDTYLGKAIIGANSVAQKLGVDATGYRLVINYGEDSQAHVGNHLHIHLLGGRKLGPKLVKE